MDLKDVWRTVKVFDLEFADYEMNPLREVRRARPTVGTYQGKILGYGKNGQPYPRLGLRNDGKTYFVPKQWIAEETFPELVGFGVS